VVRKLSSSMMFVLEKRRPATFRMDAMPLIVRASATSCTTFRSRAVSIKPCFALCCMECFTEVLTSAASAQSSHPGCDSSIVCKLTIPRSGIAGLVPHKRGPKEAHQQDQLSKEVTYVADTGRSNGGRELCLVPQKRVSPIKRASYYASTLCSRPRML
jgi:hypothetical protein